MGPIGDDLFCPCVMEQKGLIHSNVWADEKIKELYEVILDKKDTNNEN